MYVYVCLYVCWYVCMYVCMYVCLSVIKLQVTMFDPVSYFFENIVFRTMGKKEFFSFSKFSFLTFLVPFKVFFGFKKKKIIFDDLKAIFDNFWQFCRMFHLMYIVFGIVTMNERNLIFEKKKKKSFTHSSWCGIYDHICIWDGLL